MYKRNGLLYGSMICGVILLGLYTRRMASGMPTLVNSYLGDALWALMVYFIFGFLFTKTEIKKVAAIAIAFSYVIEFSQLYHRPWIDGIRKTTLGGLVLGYVFSWEDLLAYTIGILAGIVIEGLLSFFIFRR